MVGAKTGWGSELFANDHCSQYARRPSRTFAARPAQPLAVSLYPSPAARELRVSLPSNVAGEALLEISDARGPTVLRTRVRNGRAVDVSRPAAGLYLARLTAGSAVGTGKFTKE